MGALATARLGASHAGYYDYWIAAEDWIDHGPGNF